MTHGMVRGRWAGRGAADRVAVALLAGILVCLAALVLVLLLRGEGLPPKPLSGSAAPPKPVDPGRIVQTYRTGVPYRAVLRGELHGKASHKDWGVVTALNMHFVSEAEIVRTFESNNGRTLVLLQEVRRARCLAAFTKIEGLRIELPWSAAMILEGAGWLAGAQPSWSVVTIESINQLAGSPEFVGFLNSVREDPGAKVKRYVDGLENRKARLTYVNGEGVRAVEPVGGTLSEDQRAFFEASSIISDAYIFPDVECRPGDTWRIDASHLQSFLDPTLRATVSGTLTARRGPDGGTDDDRRAEFILEEGVLDLHSADEATETTAKWMPRGKLTFSFRDGIVTSAELGGRFRIVARSMDHIIFEARHTVEPKYRITYTCEVAR